MKRSIIPFILLLAFLTIEVDNSFAQKVDSVYHINGNVLTGDLKKMNYGVLEYDIDGIGTVGIEEIKINTLKSKKLFEVKMKDGEVYFGSFDTSQVDRSVNIITKDSIILVEMDKIVEIYPIKNSFWKRTSGNFALGANYSKGSDVATIVISGALYYRKKKSYFALVFDDNNTFQADTLNATKSDISFAWQRILKGYWSAEASVGLGQNSELGVNSRKAFNLILLRDLAYNSWNRLYVGGGFSFTQEIPYGNNGIDNDVSGLIQLVWRVYKFTSPKVRVNADVTYLPYITDAGRYRLIINLNPYVSILNDNLDVGLKFYYNIDNRPPIGANSNFDYGANLQISYSFH